MLYSNNVTNFVSVLVDEGVLKINEDEQVLTGDEGELVQDLEYFNFKRR